jgi:hypothetical protein
MKRYTLKMKRYTTLKMKKYTTLKMKKKYKKIKKRGGTAKKKCIDFCKNDFLPSERLIYQKIARDNNEVYKERTPKEDKYSLKVCKKIYCNIGCINKYTDTGFYADIKNDFKNDYSNEQIDKLKEKGALSGCIKYDKYLDNYL